jgi:hypothetical protein
MIPFERISLRPVPDAENALQEALNRAERAESGWLASVRFTRIGVRKCAARSWYWMPYLPVLEGRVASGRAQITCRPSYPRFVALPVTLVAFAWWGGGWTALACALLYHSAGYVCFKLIMDDVRPMLTEWTDPSGRPGDRTDAREGPGGRRTTG